MKSCTAALLFVTIVACGEASRPAPVRSPVVLSSPPTEVLFGTVGDGSFDVDGDSTTIVFRHSGEAEDTSVVVPGVRLLVTEVTVENDVLYLLAGTLDDAERFSLYRCHAATSGGAPHAGTQVLLFSSADPLYVTSLSRTGDGTTYLLDRRCQDVLVAVDTDGDHWPDRLRPVPFSRSADYEKLRHTRTIRMASTGDLRAMVHSEHPALPRWYDTYTDTDGDLVADRHVSGPMGDEPIPSTRRG